MKTAESSRREQGFSLVEILIVMAIMGMVTMAIMGLYQSTQRTAFTQEEVVEVQQNLRIAMDQIGRDVRMAGFMVPNGSTPIDTASANTLTTQTASSFGRIARVDAGFVSPAAATDTIDVDVDSGDMVDLFDSTNIVRIIRPPNHSQPLSDTFEVHTKSRTGPEITLKGFGTAGIQYSPGDVIVRTGANVPHPNTVTYSLNGTDLQRITNIANVPAGIIDTQVVASKITALEFRYLLDDGTTPLPTSVTGTDLEDVRAVEVTITGTTEATKTGADQYGTGGVRTRKITNVFTIRNR